MSWPSSQVSQIAPSSVTSPPAVLFSLRWVSAPSPENSLLPPSASSPKTTASTFPKNLFSKRPKTANRPSNCCNFAIARTKLRQRVLAKTPTCTNEFCYVY